MHVDETPQMHLGKRQKHNSAHLSFSLSPIFLRKAHFSYHIEQTVENPVIPTIWNFQVNSLSKLSIYEGKVEYATILATPLRHLGSEITKSLNVA